MSADFASIDLDYQPRLGGKTDYRIGIVGCGGIVQASHLPAYSAAGPPALVASAGALIAWRAR